MHASTPVDGKYQILAALGAGGMGEVYKVRHIHLDTVRVIKLMRSKIAEDPGAQERFLREARLATRINHPSVATLNDFSTLPDGSRYMVWEYIEGRNLHELIREQGHLGPRRAASIAYAALLGLDAIHRAGIIHRDISPENIMVSTDEHGEERVKIIDLGIAKDWDDDVYKTMTGIFVGKWKYCSPEHLGVLGQGERIDARADLYSFGIVLYEMLTGVPPFQADTPHAFLMMHSSQLPAALREVNPAVHVPADFETAIFRALEKDRSKRFASAREFAHALAPLVGGLEETDAVPAPVLPAGLTGGTVPAGPVPPRSEESFDETVDGLRARTVPSTLLPKTRSSPLTEVVETPVSPEAVRDIPATMVGSPSPAFDHRELDLVEPAGIPADTATHGRRGVGWIAAALALIALAAAVGWMTLRPASRQPVTEAAVIATPDAPGIPEAVSVVPPAPTGRLELNAFPWARVRAVRNATSGETYPIAGDLVTPVPLDLPAGSWEIEFASPGLDRTLVERVDLREGEVRSVQVAFLDPAASPLPDFRKEAP